MSSIISLVNVIIFCYLKSSMKTPLSPSLITPNEAAKLKQVSRQAVHAAMKSGKLGSVEVTITTKRITPEALAAWTPDRERQEQGVLAQAKRKPVD